jgi:hypothetical protein
VIIISLYITSTEITMMQKFKVKWDKLAL